MMRSHRGIFEADSIGRIAAKRKRIGDGKAGVFPGTADDGESWRHDLGLGWPVWPRVLAESGNCNSMSLDNLQAEGLSEGLGWLSKALEHQCWAGVRRRNDRLINWKPLLNNNLEESSEFFADFPLLCKTAIQAMESAGESLFG